MRKISILLLLAALSFAAVPYARAQMISGILYESDTASVYPSNPLVGETFQYQIGAEGAFQTVVVQLMYQDWSGWHTAWWNIIGTYSDFCPASPYGTACYRYTVSWQHAWWNIGTYTVLVNLANANNPTAWWGGPVTYVTVSNPNTGGGGSCCRRPV